MILFYCFYFNALLNKIDWRCDQAVIFGKHIETKRKVAFKHKQSKEVVSLNLKAGSLLVMKGITQKHWLHRLPPTKKVQAARINLTFRTIIN